MIFYHTKVIQTKKQLSQLKHIKKHVDSLSQRLLDLNKINGKVMVQKRTTKVRLYQDSNHNQSTLR